MATMVDLPDLSYVAAPPTRWQGAGRAAIRSMVRSRFDFRSHGEENVPRRGPVILASNHMGYIDGPLLVGFAPRPVHALVKSSMFKGRLGVAMRRMGQIPVDRRVVDPLAVKRCLAVLAAGRVVAIYPEGERGRGDVTRTKGGAAYLALVSGAPVVPVACLGTRTDGAVIASVPVSGSRLDTVFGEPIRFDAVPWPRTKGQVAEVQAEIQRTLAAHVETACYLTGHSLPAMPIIR